jgi:peptidyl-prolyl cis-trans isomerase D
MNGVYLIKVNSIAEKPADSPDVIAQKNMQEIQSQQQVLMRGWFDSLKKLADIKDDRSKYL